MILFQLCFDPIPFFFFFVLFFILRRDWQILALALTINFGVLDVSTAFISSKGSESPGSLRSSPEVWYCKSVLSTGTEKWAVGFCIKC